MPAFLNLKILKILILFVCFNLFLYSLSAQTFNEILGRPTNKTVTISLLAEQQLDVFWEYGTVSGA